MGLQYTGGRRYDILHLVSRETRPPKTLAARHSASIRRRDGNLRQAEALSTPQTCVVTLDLETNTFIKPSLRRIEPESGRSVQTQRVG